MRSLDRTRSVPILVIAEAEDNARLLRGLEIGVNDYLVRPIDKNELLARVRTQIRKKRYTDAAARQRAAVDRDGDHRRADRPLQSPLHGKPPRARWWSRRPARGKPLTLLVLDIDYFKSINDTYGHDAGDDVLREFAVRVKKSIRGIDLACRYGGEEFVIVMPETDMAVAALVAERIRRRIAGEPFAIQQGAQGDRRHDLDRARGARARRATRASVLKRADQALYRAKRDGRNRVVADAA